MKNIILTGFMGSGKTSVSMCLEEMTGLQRYEIDKLIENEAGMIVNEVFAKHGESYFRDLESKMLMHALSGESSIVSCGGGAILRDENVELMKERGTVFFLNATAETIFFRVKDSNDRPLLNENMSISHIRGLMEKRLEKYISSANYIISVDGLSIRQVSEKIAEISGIHI